MGLLSKLPSLRLVAACAAALLFLLSVPAYFAALRPRRGTTEWFRRLDRPRFAPLTAQGLKWTDALWAVLAALCAAAVQFFIAALLPALRRREDALHRLAENAPALLRAAVPCVLLALALYLLLRTMDERPLPAVLCAILAGLTQSAADALLACALLCLFVWMCAPYDARLLPRGLWLCGAVAGYAGTLILLGTALWYAPFFLGAYVWTQVLRFRGGADGHRGGKLAASLLLTVPMVLCAALGVALVRYVRAGQAASLLAALRSFRFYEGLLPTLRDGLPALVRGGVSFEALPPQTVVLSAAALGAVVPLVHGALRRRDGRRLFVLCLVPFALCAWLLGGTGPAALALLLPVGVLWQSCAERSHAAYAVGSFCTVFALSCAGMILF